MAVGGCKVWLSGLGGGPQISCKSRRQARSKHICTEDDNTNASWSLIFVGPKYHLSNG